MKTIGKISSLQWALDQIGEKPRDPDEFTALDIKAKSPGKSIGTIREHLRKLAKEGLLQSRKTIIDGRASRLYKKKA